MKNILTSLVFLALLFGMTSCEKEETPEEKKAKLEARFTAAAQNYTKIVRASYDDSFDEAKKLNILIKEFVANPSESKFNACKEQWLKSRVPYGQTEVYRFYGGPIDNEKNGPEGLINAWPMDENFIDYVAGDANAGLINNPTKYPTISKKVLKDLNEAISETSIFTGYHAIEFLLWGQDLSASSAGTRKYTDYVTGGTAKNQERRGQYLIAVSDLLLDNLNEVRSQWGSSGAYQKTFLAESRKDIVQKIFTSLGELSKGELAGERMAVAVKSGDQEDEHSCFSDNTHVDILQNFNGIVNVYNGTYKRTDGSTVSGESYAAIAKDLDATTAKSASDAIDAARSAINTIPVPFDNAIKNDGPKVLNAVAKLNALSDQFAAVKLVLDKN